MFITLRAYFIWAGDNYKKAHDHFMVGVLKLGSAINTVNSVQAP